MKEQITRGYFPSKKNFVFWNRGEYNGSVIKIFTNQGRFQMEKEIGDLLRGSNILTPYLLSTYEESLVLIYKYIEGTPVVDIIETTELTKAEEIIRKICAWMVDFYSITQKEKGCQYILGDVHLRNFLFEEAKDQVYGIDFEECRPGRIETDAARLYVFILHYDPAFTPRKRALASCVWETLSRPLQLDEAFFQQEVERETAELLVRRR